MNLFDMKVFHKKIVVYFEYIHIFYFEVITREIFLVYWFHFLALSQMESGKHPRYGAVRGHTIRAGDGP